MDHAHWYWYNDAAISTLRGLAEAVMDDEAMRKALFDKLNNPEWKAEQDRRYRQIVGEHEIAFVTPPKERREAITVPVIAPTFVREQEPTSVDGLWLGNWQRSSGALTITRYPDDTITLDHPGGDRTIFRPCPAQRNRFTWSSETVRAAGRRSETYVCPDRFQDPDEALLEMHRAALSMYTELAIEMEG
jgi:hypothetical protein